MSASTQSAPAVLIVGAGVAGLSAAVMLGRAGLRVVILEARDRIGGRILTARDAASNAPIELGAEFVHGRPPEIWDLLTDSGVEPLEMTGDNWCSRDGQLCPCDFFSRVDRLLAKLSDHGTDESFAEFLDRCGGDCDPESKRWALGYVRGFHAGDPNLISVHYLVKSARADEEIDGERAFHVPQGYDFLVQLIQRQLDPSTIVETSKPVSRIDWRKRDVRLQISNSNESFYASRVLITVPLPLLQLGSMLQFTPELPRQKLVALDHLAMGHVARVVLRFRERFWDNLPSAQAGQNLSNLRFLFSQEEWFPTWWTTLPHKWPIITGWAPSPFAEQLSGRTQDDVVGIALQSLGRLLRVEEKHLRELLQAAWWHDWQSDPFSLGAYSYVKKGGDRAQEVLGAPVEGTLFFAGETTDTSGHTGTVHGAIASGRRAANEILADMQR